MGDAVIPTNLLRLAGFVLGAVVVVVAIAGWRLPRGAGYAGSDVYIVAQPSGEIAVTPSGPILSTRDLSPGEQATGSFLIANQTGKALAVNVRLLPDRTALDGLLQVELSADGKRLFSGPLGGLRSWTATSALLHVRGHARLSFRVWLPADVTSGWQGQVETVPIELRAAPATGVA